MVAVSIGGCASPGPAVDVEAMRGRIATLEQRVSELERRNMELIGELARAEAAGEAPAEVRANTPHVSAVSIGRRSHGRDHSGDGRAEELVIYLQPTDGRGRFVQLVGTVTVSAAVAEDEMGESDAEDFAARTIGRIEVGPAALREAYRSGVTGTHYTLTLPIRSGASAGHDKAIVRVRYRDGWTGLTYDAERRIELIGPRVRPARSS